MFSTPDGVSVVVGAVSDAQDPLSRRAVEGLLGARLLLPLPSDANICLVLIGDDVEVVRRFLRKPMPMPLQRRPPFSEVNLGTDLDLDDGDNPKILNALLAREDEAVLGRIARRC